MSSSKSQTEKFSVIVQDAEASSIEEVDIKSADNSLAFMESHADEFSDATFTAEEQKALDKALYYKLFPLLLAVNTVLFMDKATFSYASILGLYDSTNLDDSEYDNTNSLFYTGYALGEFCELCSPKE